MSIAVKEERESTIEYKKSKRVLSHVILADDQKFYPLLPPVVFHGDPLSVRGQVHETFDFVIGRAVASLPKFVGYVEKNLRRTRRNKTSSASSEGTDGVSGGRHRSRTAKTLRNGVLYMRGEVSQNELSELGAQPTTVICLEDVLQGKREFKDDPQAEGVDAELDAAGSGQVLDVGNDDGDGNGRSSKGYSSVFHFSSEDIWNRMPVVTTTPAAIAGAAAPAS